MSQELAWLRHDKAFKPSRVNVRAEKMEDLLKATKSHNVHVSAKICMSFEAQQSEFILFYLFGWIFEFFFPCCMNEWVCRWLLVCFIHRNVCSGRGEMQTCKRRSCGTETKPDFWAECVHVISCQSQIMKVLTKEKTNKILSPSICIYLFARSPLLASIFVSFVHMCVYIVAWIPMWW